jgi:hypothetical protein
VFNIEMARLMHRHGDDWVEMTPVGGPSPDARDLERGLLGGRKAYRCTACDEEISIQQPDPAA